MVAEVMNAKSQTAGVNLIHQNEGKNQPIPLSGAWRIWFEHPSATDQIQHQPVPVPRDTKPAHAFTQATTTPRLASTISTKNTKTGAPRWTYSTDLGRC